MDYRKAFDLTGSVAVVTGGPRGIGVESAVALGPCGAKVVLAARRSKCGGHGCRKSSRDGRQRRLRCSGGRGCDRGGTRQGRHPVNAGIARLNSCFGVAEPSGVT